MVVIGRQGGGAVGVKLLILITGILFIVHSIRGSYVIMGWYLKRDITGYAVPNIPILSGEGVIHKK